MDVVKTEGSSNNIVTLAATLNGGNGQVLIAAQPGFKIKVVGLQLSVGQNTTVAVYHGASGSTWASSKAKTIFNGLLAINQPPVHVPYGDYGAKVAAVNEPLCIDCPNGNVVASVQYYLTT